MCGVTSHNVTHDVTGSAGRPKAKRDGTSERLSPTQSALLDWGNFVSRMIAPTVCQKT